MKMMPLRITTETKAEHVNAPGTTTWSRSMIGASYHRNLCVRPEPEYIYPNTSPCDPSSITFLQGHQQQESPRRYSEDTKDQQELFESSASLKLTGAPLSATFVSYEVL